MLKSLGLLRKQYSVLAHPKLRTYTNCDEHCFTVAVVLSGCGVYDGSEIHEASATLAHLTRHNMLPVIYAPDITQTDVINHQLGEPTNEKRCVSIEAARIARGPVKPLCQLTPDVADAVIFPGGFGVAKTLSSFATDGTNCSVNMEVCGIIDAFRKARKPQAFMCISPILAARAIHGVTVTFGRSEPASHWPHGGAIAAAGAMGATVQDMDVDCVCYDPNELVLSTPAFMYNGKFHEIYDGIGNLIGHLECILKGIRTGKVR